MKLIFCVTLSLILNNVNVDADAVDLIKKIEKTNEDDYETQFTDLSVECVLIILEKMDFGSLLNVTQINDRFSALATDVFRRKHSHSTIVIPREFKLPDDPKVLLNVAGMKINTNTIQLVNENTKIHNYSYGNPVPSDWLELETGDQILNTFKHFGHLIKRLKFDMLDDLHIQAELIGRLIKKYSLTSLCYIEFLGSATFGLLKHIKKPLINVKIASFNSIKMKLTTSILDFDEQFPAVNRLILFALSDKEFAYFDHHMPQLEHVSIGQSELQLMLFPKFLKKNPQIRSIQLHWSDAQFVREVKLNLPQLQMLELSHFFRSHEYIQFENVTTFSIAHKYRYSPLHFPNLQTLHITDSYEFFLSEYLPFLERHNHTRHLHVTHGMMDDTHFQQLTANMENLVQLTLERRTDMDRIQPISSAIIVEFLRSHTNVKQLNVINYPMNSIVELQNELGFRWTVTIDGAETFDETLKLFKYKITAQCQYTFFD